MIQRFPLAINSISIVDVRLRVYFDITSLFGESKKRWWRYERGGAPLKRGRLLTFTNAYSAVRAAIVM